MRPAVLLFFAMAAVAPLPATAGPPVIQNTSIVRVRADNHFGVTKDHVITPTFDLVVSDSITDTEIGTTATATTSADYDIRLTGTGAVFGITTQQSYSVQAQGNLTEGFIQFTIDEPYVYELSGSLTGMSGDAGDGYQQRTFLRFFQTPFTTVFLEDETGFGTIVMLAVNQQNDTGSGGIYNQSGPRLGVLNPGTYEFAYELESRDNDVDGAASSTATGSVQLILRKPLPPTTLTAQVNGFVVNLAWSPSPDASSYQLEAGSAPGLSDLFIGDVGNVTGLQATVPAGVYYVRVRAKIAGLLSVASNEVAFGVGTGGCIQAPPPPTGHAAAVNGLSVTLSWNLSVGATSYVLEAGSGSGQANLFNADVGPANSLSSGAPAGTYFTRVRARNACGTSLPSNEVQFVLACAPPAAPASLSFAKSGPLLTLTWNAAAGAASYRLQAGTASGLSDLFDGVVGAGTSVQFNVSGLPAGTYFVRVLAGNSCGTSGASNEVAIPIP